MIWLQPELSITDLSLVAGYFEVGLWTDWPLESPEGQFGVLGASE